jgi:hypothetical protein
VFVEIQLQGFFDTNYWFKEREVFMTEKIWNKNVRFNTNNNVAIQAWDILHSDEVEQDFKSQNEFIICAINDYYERHIRKKNDPYLETREKEDAFADRIVEKVERKVLSNLPALLGLYVVKNNHSEDREE